MKSDIKYLVMDVDGTLTDGKIYMGKDGEAVKAFNIKDGCGIHDILIPSGITPIIITGRSSKIVANRCKELGIEHYYQGVENKIEKLLQFLKGMGGDLSEVAYAGDDLNDLACMTKVKENGGLVGVPANACEQVKGIADYVAKNSGGEGAVRSFIEFLVSYNNGEQFSESSINKRCIEAVEFLSKLKDDKLSLGRHDVNEIFYYDVKEYETQDNLMKHFESHCKYVDVQMIISGEENLQMVDINKLQVEVTYDEIKDRILYHPIENTASIVLRPGSAVILYPKDAHRTIAYNGESCKVKKVVGKIRIF